MKIAVITPYFKEGRDVLQRCMESVRTQCIPVDQILVADGHPQNWVESHHRITHVVLPKNAGDFGDTPRCLGFLLGLRSGYDILQFLDVDNILMPDHFEVVLEHFRDVANADFPDVVVSRRHMLRPDGSVLPIGIPEDDERRHIDTNCYVFYRTAFELGLRWSLIPKQLAFMDDRVFYGMLVTANVKIAFNQRKTVGYTCLWESAYRRLGEEPPPNCRNIEGHRAEALAWWRALDRHTRRIIERQLGVPIFETPNTTEVSS